MSTGNGRYLYIETSAPRHQGDIAILDSPRLPPTPAGGVCVSFWYFMYGGSIGSLQIYLTQSTNDSLFWQRNGTQGAVWKQAQETIMSPVDYRLSIRGYVGNGYQGDIAIDDFNVSNGACPPNGACDFETGFCGWTQSTTDDFDWLIGKSGTASAGTGPRVDHTLQSVTGHFAFIETSAPRQPNDRAILKSMKLAGTTDRCLRFYYNMNGVSIGSLNIYIQRDGETATQVWSRTGNQQDIWRLGTLTLASHNKGFIVLIEGVRGANYQGDIAIDDVIIRDGACPATQTCNFEQDLCGWTNARNGNGDNYDWIRGTGANPRQTRYHIHPNVDHTLSSSSGHFMFLSTNTQVANRQAYLYSDDLRPTTGMCLQFWYHLYNNVGALSVNWVQPGGFKHNIIVNK